MASDRHADGDARSAIVTLFIVLFSVAFAYIIVFEGLGFGAVLGETLSGGEAFEQEPTLEDYDAVESIEVVNETVVVRIEPGARFASAGEWETRGTHDPKKRCQRCHSERPIHYRESTGLVRFAVVLCYGLVALGYSWLRDAVGRL